MEKETKNIVECNVCGQRYEDLAGSTPCCGSIAFAVYENGNKTESMVVYAQVNKK